MKPIIGITSYEEDLKGHHNINNAYIDAVYDAGGVPVIIPTITKEEDYDIYLNILDGIIFSGGIDVSPLEYNENPLKEINRISSRRDRYEINLFKKAFEREIPILGICRGAQMANVALGGSLYQDINSQLPNALGHSPRSIARDEFFHSIDIKEDSRLFKILGKSKVFVNSYHHQAVKDLGENLRVTALSEDGIIEAIEAEDNRFFIGLQFHPEGLQKRYREFLEIFKALIEEAKK